MYREGEAATPKRQTTGGLDDKMVHPLQLVLEDAIDGPFMSFVWVQSSSSALRFAASLGAVLFVMLGGRYPFDGKAMPLEAGSRVGRWHPQVPLAVNEEVL